MTPENQTKFTPVEDYRDTFAKQGYLVFESFLAREKINEIADDLNWLVETQLAENTLEPARDISDPVQRLSRNLVTLHASRPEAQGWIYDEVNRRPLMYTLASSPELLDKAGSLLSGRIAIHPRMNMVMSMPHDEWHTAVWHQDRFYGPANHLIAYIPLQKSSIQNGGLTIAPGSHKNGILEHKKNQQHKINSKWITIDEDVVANFPDTIDLILNPGDLLLFDGYLPHSANVNQSDDVRFAITIRYSDLSDPFFIKRGWVWQDLAEEGLAALQSRKQGST